MLLFTRNGRTRGGRELPRLEARFRANGEAFLARQYEVYGALSRIPHYRGSA
jgi:hypothetical protein